MALQRAYSAAMALNGRIVIAGGMADEASRVDTFEIFDPDTSGWTELSMPPERKQQRPFLAACVLLRQS